MESVLLNALTDPGRGGGVACVLARVRCPPPLPFFPLVSMHATRRGAWSKDLRRVLS